MLMESEGLLPQSKKLRVDTAEPIEELSLIDDLSSPSIELPGFPPLSVNTDLASQEIDLLGGLQQSLVSNMYMQGLIQFFLLGGGRI